MPGKMGYACAGRTVERVFQLIQKRSIIHARSEQLEKPGSWVVGTTKVI
jgi:hypothetical protein